MIHKLEKLLVLPQKDKWTLLQAWVLVLCIDLALRLMPFPRAQKLVSLGKKSPAPESITDSPAAIERLNRLASIAAHNHLYPMLCLRRSLTLQWLLNRHGISTNLQFGVKKDIGEFAAHAWLEYQGTPIGERQDVEARYAPLLVQEAGR